MDIINSIFQFIKPTYNLDSVIQRMKEDSIRGDKIALFIGRTPDQPVPREIGWSWFTLDINLQVTESTITKNDGFTTDRHLKIDVNNKDEMKKIAHRVNKIVVDGSVVKFMHPVWDNLLQTAVPAPESEIFIQEYAMSYVIFDISETEFLINDMTIRVSKNDLTKSVANKDYGFKELFGELNSRAEKHLKLFCDQVEIKSSDTFPHYDLIKWTFQSYWHLKGIKPFKEKEVDVDHLILNNS